MQDLSKEILTEIEQEKVAKFCEDHILFQAVKKYVLAVAYKQGVVEKGVEHKGGLNYAINLAWGATQQNGTPRSDEELGQNLRALTHAVQLVESGFNELTSFQKVVEPQEEKINPAE